VLAHSIVFFPVQGHGHIPVPRWRPYPVLVQCHPGTPGPLPWAVWEEAAGDDDPGGHGA
uniref:Uncharacterized protein n=1 Tax=Suricata suricatta TaxID=37032 RepID=A0A673VGS6_SURSU